MKTFRIVLCCLLVLLTTAACAPKSQSVISGQGHVFEAVVLEVHEDRILIMPDASSKEAGAAMDIGLVVAKSEKIPVVKEGDRVRIDYDGTMTRSIPAQLGQIYRFEVI